MLDLQTYGSIFLPHIMKRQLDAMANGTRFVHYTTAQAAMSIIARKKVWLRNILFMNYFSEVSFGIDAVLQYFGGEKSIHFWSFVNDLTSGKADKIKADFDRWQPDLRTRTYVCCLSEHDVTEDRYGRLSMWRGYGDTTGVGIVINPQVLYTQTDALAAYTYPVIYIAHDDVPGLFDSIVASILAGEAALRTQTPDEIEVWVLDLLLSLPFYLKHPGFAEEREWRVVHRPSYEPSKRLEPRMEAVKGFPQRLYEIPLEDVPEEDLVGLSPNALVNRILIGPTEHPVALYHAFVDLLSEVGVDNASAKVVVSDIPYRPT